MHVNWQQQILQHWCPVTKLSPVPEENKHLTHKGVVRAPFKVVASSVRREYSESKIKAYAVGSKVEQVNLDKGNLHILPPFNAEACYAENSISLCVGEAASG